MLFFLVAVGGLLMVGSCLALAFEDVIESKSNIPDVQEEKL